ncbi:MAG TPA: ferredoxin [Candidatus Nanoarchaeia archaeon]|nr:ferredoxin [Candidatus Nanoarchaeia archaeon]
MPKIIIDREKCQGYGVCVSICPQVFQLDKEGKSMVINQDCQNCDCQRAASSCPTQAISIEE